MGFSDHPRRRGGVYVAVLGTAMIVTLIGMTALSLVRAQRQTAVLTSDTAQARAHARSAIELGLQLMASDSSWRTNRSNGAWVTKQTIGTGSLSITATDPVDGNLANRPTDSVILQGIGYQGNARQIMETTVVASGVALDSLANAIHAPGDLNIGSGNTLTVTGAPASTNTTLTDTGTVAGDARCLTATSVTNVSGKLTIAAPVLANPSSGIVAMYTAIGTAIAPGAIDIQKFALGPGVNPWGTPNAEGVYVLTPGADITIHNCRILGTLVIVNSGRKVTIRDNVLIQPFRPDYPSLIIDANVVLQHDSTTSLSEATLTTNFNPAGMPYSGVTDADTSDSYPSEIQGLVHIRGTLQFNQAGSIIRGAILCESSAVSKAIDVAKSAQIIYDPTLYTSPPMGYTKSYTMTAKAGTFKQVVLP